MACEQDKGVTWLRAREIKARIPEIYRHRLRYWGEVGLVRESRTAEGATLFCFEDVLKVWQIVCENGGRLPHTARRRNQRPKCPRCGLLVDGNSPTLCPSCRAELDPSPPRGARRLGGGDFDMNNPAYLQVGRGPTPKGKPRG